MTSENDSEPRPSRARLLVRRLRGLRLRGLRLRGVRLRDIPLLVPKKRPQRYVGSVLVALVAAGSITQIAVAQASALPEGAVYRIGDTVVNKEQFEYRNKVMRVLYGVTPPKDEAKLDQFRRASAKAIAVSDILDRSKQEAGVTVAEKEASDQLDKVIQQSYPQGGRKQFIAVLGEHGISERDVLDEIKRQLGNSRLYEKLTHSAPPASEADARNYFNQHKEQMVQPEQRHLRNIVTDSEAKAKQVLSRVKSGEDFAAVAREVSMDSSSKENGGDLGTVVKEQLDPAYGKVAFGAPDKGIFGPTKTAQGWHVGQVLNVQKAVPLSFDEVKKQVIDQVNTERKLEIWNSWLRDQISSAGVEYADKYRPQDPDGPPNGGAPQ